MGEPKGASTGREHEFFTESSGDRENYAAGIRGIGPAKRERGEISGNSFETEKYGLMECIVKGSFSSRRPKAEYHQFTFPLMNE